MKNLLIAILLFAIASPAFPIVLGPGQSLVVTGTGRVSVPPDTAEVRLGVEITRSTATLAQSDNAAAMQRVLAAIGRLGLPKDMIQTSSFNIWPETTYDQKTGPKVVGYRCSNQVNVTMDDLSKVSKVIDAGIDAGANKVLGVVFSRKNDLEEVKQALGLAISEASAKAKTMAGAAGVRLKEIDKIIEGEVQVRADNVFAVRAMEGAGGGTPVATGMMEITRGVTLIYRVEK